MTSEKESKPKAESIRNQDSETVSGKADVVGTGPTGKFFKARKPWIIGGSLAAIAVLILVGFFLAAPNILYKNKALPNTSYGGVRLSSNLGEAKDQIWKRSDDVKIKLSLNGEIKEYSQDQVGAKINKEATYQVLEARSNGTGFFSKSIEALKEKDLKPVVDFDSAKLKDLLKNDYADGQAPEDAKVEYSQESRSFVVVEEKRGRGVEYSDFEKSLGASLGSMSSEPIPLSIKEVDPDIKASDLERNIGELNAALSISLSIDGPIKDSHLSGAELASYLDLSLDNAAKEYTLSLNSDKVGSFVDKALAANSRKAENRVVANIDGGQIVLNEGSGGIELVDPNGFKNGFMAEAAKLKPVSRSLDYRGIAPGVEDVAATNGRWIFADLSQFKIYAYEGSHLVNTLLMSSGAPSTPTPPGRYAVMSKVRVKTMRGGTPGTRDYYEVPNIEWVAYFKSGGYAMHGVYWHNNFGIKNTSHGCMGMRNSDAQWVYDFVSVGTPVIIVP